MRFLFTLSALLLAPAAHAGMDFKCESVKYSDQLSGWLRFGFNGGNGQVQLDYWNGYPPIAIVDSLLDNGTNANAGETRFTSVADRQFGTVAVVDVPAGFLKEDKFLAKLTLHYKAAPGRPAKDAKHQLNCVRH